MLNLVTKNSSISGSDMHFYTSNIHTTTHKNVSCKVIQTAVLINGVARTQTKLRTSKVDYWIKQ